MENLWDDDTLLEFAGILYERYADFCLEDMECKDCPHGISIIIKDGTREFECAGTFAGEIWRRLMNKKLAHEGKTDLFGVNWR